MQKDTRYSEHAISTHDQDHIPANALDKLEEIDAEHWKQYDVIAIDEGQFFPDLADAIERFACQGKVVIVSALNGTFERRVCRQFALYFGFNCQFERNALSTHNFLQGFSAVMDAIPLADRIDHLTAVCASCGLEAPYSKRISNETDVEVIGSDDKYLPMCRRCFHGMTPNGDLENFNSVGYTTPTKHSREVLSDETNKGSDPKQQYRDRQDTPEQESVNTDPTLGTPTALNDL